MPMARAPRRVSSLPVTSGWRRAQARAARRLAKKLIYPQERSAAERQASPAEPANTTAVRGCQRAWLPTA